VTTPDSNPSEASRNNVFATTHWTVVLAAGRQNAPEADVALEQLCRTYWYPLYAYVRRHGYKKADAEDLVQGFFARFLHKNYLEGLSSDKGHFRAFLLACLKHFLANEWERAKTAKRGGGQPALSLDWQSADEKFQIEPADNLSPDKLYDRAWAVTLLERVISRLGQECEQAGQAKIFQVLKPILMVGKGAIPYAEAASKLEIAESAVRVAVHRFRRRFRELVKDEIAQTLSEPQQVEEEIHSLFGAFEA
jgi:RNA polymerase sigma factor (sigma-70 family)